MQVGNVYSAPKVLAGTEITSVESAQGQEFVNSWRVVQDFAPEIKLNPQNLAKLAKYISDEGAHISKLRSSAKGIEDPEIMQSWIDVKLPRSTLDELYTGIKADPPANIDPWTPNHKSQRWNNYKEGDGDLSFESWSNVYDGNIKKAKKGNKKVKDYAAQNGLDIPESGFERVWKEVDFETGVEINKKISIELRGENVEGLRRHDIYDADRDKRLHLTKCQ